MQEKRRDDDDKDNDDDDDGNAIIALTNFLPAETKSLGGDMPLKQGGYGD